MSGFAFGAGVPATAAEGSVIGWSRLGFSVGAGVATSAGEASIFGWSEFGAGVGVTIAAASGSVSGWSTLGVGSGADMIAGRRAPAGLLDSPGLSFAVDSPAVSFAPGVAIVDGMGVVSALEPTDFSVARCESASVGAPTVSALGTSLLASATQ